MTSQNNEIKPVLGSRRNDIVILSHLLIFFSIFNSAEKWLINIRFSLPLFLEKRVLSVSIEEIWSLSLH